MWNQPEIFYNVLFANFHVKLAKISLINVQVVTLVSCIMINAFRIVQKGIYKYIKQCNVQPASIHAKIVLKSHKTVYPVFKVIFIIRIKTNVFLNSNVL